MAITAIQTSYHGYLFRSRLEARWAVFFNTLKLSWEYEPEGYKLPSGTHYLPDFRVIIGGVVHWFEIKPGDQGQVDKFDEFMTAAPEECCGAVLNDIPDPVYVRENGGYYYPGTNSDRPYKQWGGAEGGWDNLYRFCICPKCQKIGFEFEGRSERIGCNCKEVFDKTRTSDHPTIVAAFAKARAARFEHADREGF